MDCELLLSGHSLFTPAGVISETSRGRKNCYLLFTFVFVGSLQMINRHKLSECSSNTVHPINVDTEIQYAVQGITVESTLLTGDPRPQATSKDFVHPRRLGKFGVDFSELWTSFLCPVE